MNFDIISNDSNAADRVAKAIQARITKSKTYKWYSDAGHAWLKVSIKEVKDLDICHKISSYSYINNGNVYLECDCDAELFINAKEQATNSTLNFDEVNCGDNSTIRNFNRFYNF